MSNFLIFTTKEMRDVWRTGKFRVLFWLFIVLAAVSPNVNLGALITISYGNMRWEPAFANFYMAVRFIVPVVLIVLFGGIISNEREQGTMETALLKGLHYHAFVLSKLFVMALAALAAYVVGFLILYFYTFALFQTAPEIHMTIGAAAAQYGLLLLTSIVIVISSSLFKNSIFASVLAFVLWAAIMFVLVGL